MTSAVKVFIVTGTSASGKSGVSKFLQRNYPGYDLCNVGDVLAEKLPFSEFSKAERFKIGTEFIALFGVEGIFDVLETRIKQALNNNYSGVVIDGIRYRSTLIKVKQHFPRNKHIHVVADTSRLAMRRMLREGNKENLNEQDYSNIFDAEAKELARSADMIVSTTKGRAFSITNGPDRDSREIRDINLERI